MRPRTSRFTFSCIAAPWLLLAWGATAVLGQQPAGLGPAVTPPPPATLTADVDAFREDATSSVEQGRTTLTDSFELDRQQWRLEKRRTALESTQLRMNSRTYFFNRHNFDGSENEALATGGSLGFKTGHFFDRVALGATGYGSVPLYGPKDKDGTQLLKPGQEGYIVLGEAYADVKIIEDVNLYVGRKEYDTPYINGNDSRMSPNTFEAIVLQGRLQLDDKDATFKYGLGYFDRIKERNADQFVSMSVDAGATVERGVYTAGAIYKKGRFSVGAIDYYCPDIINIGYAEAKMEFPIRDNLKPRLALQFTDQRSVGDDLLTGEGFSGQQYGVKAELPAGNALFTTAYTFTTDGTDMQSPWSGYPGYTSVQVQDFDRAGEGALLLRAAYNFTCLEGLSAYALWVHGFTPDEPGQFRQDECDLNLQWAPTEGLLKGLSLRVRYAAVEQHGGDVDRVHDFRATLNYTRNF